MSRSIRTPAAPLAVVVNDDPTQLAVLSALVRKAGLEPRGFTGAEAALADMSARAAAADEDPDDALPALIVTDLYMPGIDGWRFCRLLRSPEYAAFNQVPILLVSATYAGEEVDRIAADLGAEAFFNAPVDGKRFVEQVRAILKGRQVSQPPRALIVEDDKSLAGILKKALAAHGYQADTAGTARAAADGFAKAAYHVAVLDHHLPDGTGDALLDAFRAERPDCVCLMMTTDPGPELALDWMKRGAAAYLRKPFKPEYLIELCERARRERALLRVQDLLEVRTRELRESEEKHFVLLEQSSDPIFSLTPEGRYTFANRAFAEGVGKRVEDIIGKSIWDVFPREEAYRRFASLSEVICAGEERVIEVRVPLADSDRYYITTITPIKDAAGEAVAAICSSKEITDRKRAEEELQANKLQLSNALEMAHLGHWTYDVADDLFTFNDHFYKIFRTTVSQVGGYTMPSAEYARRFVHPDDSDMVGEATRQAIATTDPHFNRQIEHRMLYADGTVGDIAVRFFIVKDSHGRTVKTYGVNQDITDRKRTEEALRENVERMRAIVEGTPHLFFYLQDAEANTTYVSPTVEQITGHPPAVWLQRRDWFVTDAPFNQTARERTRANLRGELSNEPVLLEVRHALGHPLLLEAHEYPITRDGRVVGLQGVAHDITRRRQAEDARRESEERFRRVSAMTSDIAYSCRTNEDGRFSIDWMTGAADRITGYSSEEIKAQGCWRFLVVEEDRAVFEEHVLGLAPGSRDSCELRIRRKNGGIARIASFAECVSEPQTPGRLSLYGGLVDITERKRAEEALRESEERFRHATESLQEAVWYADLSGQFTFLSPVMAHIYGRPLAEMMGNQEFWFEAAHPEDRPAVHDSKEVLLREYRVGLEYRIILPDGTVRWIADRKLLLRNEHGEPFQVAGIISDITDRKRAEAEKAALEAQLQQSQKMESVGRLAGGVAHDFNNMLGVILGHSEIALGQVDPSQPLHAHLHEIRQAARRSADLTRQLLAFARKQTIAPQVLDLDETVAGMLKMLRRLIGEDISLSWQPEPGLWPVWVDPSQIDQILANLCVNARDAIAGVGRITIETTNATFDADYCAVHLGFVPGEYVRLTVSDDGCGMDQKTLALVFEPFFTTKGVGAGTGLGLATVYGIVKQNEGFINAVSEPGQGTTFAIYLPRYAGKAEEARGEGEAQPLGRGHETILLVEDEPAILEMAAEMLGLHGYVVLAAGTPGEAIRLAREHAGAIHLLVTDVIMPEMNGRDLARNLLSVYPHIKRVFMSGYTADVIAHRGVVDDGVHFLQKPFSIKDLAAKVREALEGD